LVASVFSSGTVPITGTVTFESGSTVIGTASLTSAGTATLTPTLAVGTYSIVAVYSGDANNAASTSSAVTVTVTAADDFSMNVNPTSITMATKQYQTVTLTLSSTSGFADTLGLGCASLPASVTCSFSNSSVALAANGTASVQVTVDTSSPLTAGGSAKNDQPGRDGSRTALAWTFPGSLALGLICWRFRRKHGLMYMFAALVLLGGTVFGLTGCGGLSENGATPGTYSFEITATGQKTGMDHAVTINLTVNQ
ncbi:Ig-like domain-containing protein, partial [Silvibacterium sp.]|uniref:Ig-like domain-containing protein n=1 Tax=Silvibacterium sp. TaxID=1964179 RepID=UPI0039E37412